MHALQLGNCRFLHTRHLQEYISKFFFRPYFHYCLLSSVHYCGDLSHIHIFIHCSHMIFIYSQSFIHHSTGLFGINIMISFQLACQLSWQTLHWYHRGHGFIFHTGLNFFFQVLFYYWLFRQCQLLQRSLSYSPLCLLFKYTIFMYSQSFTLSLEYSQFSACS